MSTLTFAAIPQVMDDDEMPFVIGLTPDPRPSLEIDSFQFRRGTNACAVDFGLGDLRMRAALRLIEDGQVYLMANAGPLLNEWWPMLNRSPHNPLRPWLSAGVARQPLVMRPQVNPTRTSVKVAVVRSSPSLETTSLVVGLGPGMTDDTLALGAIWVGAVVKAALEVLGEYRDLVQEVPTIDVQNEWGPTLSLKDLLTYAALAADAIAWERVP